nr:hypothetical protein GCM10025699_46360 [Microbacterium flavescens]
MAPLPVGAPRRRPRAPPTRAGGPAGRTAERRLRPHAGADSRGPAADRRRDDLALALADTLSRRHRALPEVDGVDGEATLDETPPTELTALTPATPDEAWTIVVPPAAVRPVHEALARVRRRLGPRAGR